MSTTHFIYQSDFGRKILIRQVFLSGDNSFTALSVLTKMMNSFPNFGNKKSLHELSGASVRFNLRRFNSGYLFEGWLEQTQSSVLSYLFMNPFRTAEEMFSFAFEHGPIFDEKKLAIIKERLLWENSLRKQSSLSALNDLLLNEKELKEIKKEDLLSLVEKIQGKEEGMMFYFGEKIKEPIYFPVDYQRQPKLNFSLKEDDIICNDVLDEAVEFVFQCKEMKNSSDNENLYGIMEAMKVKSRFLLKNIVSVDFKLDAFILDASHFVLRFLTKSKKAFVLSEAFSRVEKEAYANLDEAKISQFRQARKIEEKMNPVFFVRQVLEEEYLGLNSKEESQSISDISSSISLVSHRIVRKGE